LLSAQYAGAIAPYVFKRALLGTRLWRIVGWVEPFAKPIAVV